MHSSDTSRYTANTRAIIAFSVEFAISFFALMLSRVLLTPRVGYHAGKPIESVVYCLKIAV